jgi:GNAT superfamily N-acetyltransferase
MTTGIVTRERLRPALPCDAPALHAMFARCSADTTYGRFHGRLRALPDRYLTEALAGDPALHDALVVETPEDLVALASARRLDEPGEPAVEIGLLVEDAAQGRGLGTGLLLALAGRARSRGVAVLRCDVLAGNRRLVDTLRRALGPVAARSDGLIVHASVRLLAGGAPLPWRAS